VLAGALAGVQFLGDLTARAGPGWTWIAGGFVATVLVLAPVAESSFGARTGEWSRTGGTLVGVALIVAYVALAQIARDVGGVPQAIVSGLSSGMLLAAAVFVATHVFSRGTVEGW